MGDIPKSTYHISPLLPLPQASTVPKHAANPGDDGIGDENSRGETNETAEVSIYRKTWGVGRNPYPKTSS